MGKNKELKELRQKIKKLSKDQKNLAQQLEQLQQVLAFSDTSSGVPAPSITASACTAIYPPPLERGKYSPRYAQYRVSNVQQLTPTVIRVAGVPASELKADIQGLLGEYIYVITGKSGEVLPEPRTEGKKPAWDQPISSTKYTVRQHNTETGELEINIVLHERGAGTTWARNVAVGDIMHVVGAKSGYRTGGAYDFYLMAGDETGLPGMARWAEGLPKDARGALFIEVPGTASRQNLKLPPGVEVIWVDSLQVGALATAVQGYPLPQGSIFAWLAGESTSLQPLRSWVRKELKMPKGHGYSKGYWKRK